MSTLKKTKDVSTVLVANDNARKIEKPQLSIVGGKGEG